MANPAVVVSISGIEEVSRNMKDVGERVTKEAQTNLEKSAFNIEKGAKQICPVDTGTLYRSIKVEKIGKDSFKIGPHTTYDAYVEFGTTRMSEQPYLRPAYEAEIPKLKDALHKLVKK